MVFFFHFFMFLEIELLWIDRLISSHHVFMSACLVDYKNFGCEKKATNVIFNHKDVLPSYSSSVREREKML